MIYKMSKEYGWGVHEMKNTPCLMTVIKKTKQAWRCTSVIPALGRLKQEDHEFKVKLGYILRPCPKKKGNRTRR
jgi:hypothetical protein